MQYPVAEMVTDAFSGWFSTQLKRRKWSAADFHRESGVARSTVGAWVRGTRLPDPASIDLIADVFGLPVDDVLTIPPTEPAGDNRVQDRDRYLDDRRREILAHMALWERSRKPYAREELAYWQAELEHLDREAAG